MAYIPKIIPYSKYPLARIITIYEIVSADYVHGVHPNEHAHVHQDAWELTYCIEGNFLYCKDGKYIPLQTGDIIFTSPGTAHDSLSQDPETKAFYVSFTCSDDQIKLLRDAVVTATQQQQELFQKVIGELELAFQLNESQLRVFSFSPSKDSPLGAEQLVCCYLEQIMISILREITMQNGKPVKSAHFVQAMENYLISNVSDYIRSHLSQPLTVGRIAEQFHYSRARLSTLYKASTGMGINEFINHERIYRAKVLLLAGDLTIAQISEQVGFTSPQYFSRKFTQFVGAPPSHYAALRQDIRRDTEAGTTTYIP